MPLRLLSTLLVATLAGPAARGPAPLAILHVQVLPMDRDTVLADRAVLVRDGRIAEIAPAEGFRPPPGAEVVEGRGRWLLPGLVDMHVHLNREDLPAYVAAGVTTVRNMWGFPEVWAMKRDVERGDVAGPTIYTTSPAFDSVPPVWSGPVLVTDPALADSAVEAQYEAGYRTIKIYQNLRRDVYDAVVRAARARGMDFVGHVPDPVGLAHALEVGQRSIEHLTGYDRVLTRSGGRGATPWISIRRDAIDSLARATRRAGVWNCPTLSIYLHMAERLSPEDRRAVIENRRAVVRALHAAGAPLLAGTDSGLGITAPGASLHVELRELVASGLTPYEAIRVATRGAAEFLGAEDEFGAVRPGLRADLLLVSGDPRSDLSVLEHPDGVVLRGRWLPGGTPAPEAADPCAGFAGEVHAGEAFERPFGDGLLFRLRPTEHAPPNPAGWTIEVRRGEDGAHDFVWVATPPYRFYNPRDLTPSYGESAADVVAMDTRDFGFVRSEEEYETLAGLVRFLLWKPEGMTEARYEAATDSVRTRWEAMLERVGHGRLRITDADVTGPEPHLPGGRIERLAFRVTLCPVAHERL